MTFQLESRLSPCETLKFLLKYTCSRYFVVPAKKSSHYVKGVLIGAVSTMGVALVVLVPFLWIRWLSKKERAAKRYTEVKKQVVHEPSNPQYSLQVMFLPKCCPTDAKPSLYNRHKTYYFSR